MRRVISLLTLLSLWFAPLAQAGGLFGGDIFGVANTFTALQTFSAGATVVSPLDLQFSSVLLDRFSVNSSGNLLFQATEKAPSTSTAALAGLGAGNVDSGTHSYKITFVTAGGETDAGAVSGTVTTTAGNGQVSLSVIPLGSTYVTSRKVYRTAAGNAVTGPWLLLATIADNTTTTHADNIADASLTTAISSTNTAIDTRITLANSGLATFSAGILLGSDDTLAWGNAVGGGTADTFLSRVSAAKLNFGAPDSSSPVAQTLTFQGYNNAVATAGPLAIIQGSNGGLTSGTGGELRLQGGLSGAAAGTGGAVTIYTAPAGAGTTPALAVTIGSTKLATFIGSVNVGSVLGMSGAFTAQTYTSGVNWQFYNGFSNGNFQFSTGSSTGGVGIAVNSTFTPASLLDLRAGDLTMSGANGQKYVLGRKTELITVASGVLTQASTITIPADAILEAAEIRFTVQPGGTATAVVTATTSATVLQQGASMSTAVGTTDVGTRANGANYTGVAAQTVTFTFNGVTSDALGRIRLDIFYKQATVATS